MITTSPSLHDFWGYESSSFYCGEIIIRSWRHSHGGGAGRGEGGTFWAAEVSINIHHKHKKELIKINKQRKKPMILKLENI